MTSTPETNDSTNAQDSGAQDPGYHRRKLHQPVEIEWGSSTLTGTVRDIGPKGMFVELKPPLWLGATFSARLMLNPVMRLNCTVRRIEPGEGNAVTFDLPEESAQEQLKLLLDTLPEA